MTNILLSRRNIGEPLRKELKKRIKKGDKVAVVAFSLKNAIIASAEDWDKFYGLESDFRREIEEWFSHFGITPEAIEYIGFFGEEAAEQAKTKLQNADIVVLPDGVEDEIMQRTIKLDLYNDIEEFDGVIIGFGAGAKIQLSEYHFTGRDGRLRHSLGFRFAAGFNVETNYCHAEEQIKLINQVVSEINTTVFAIGEEGALIIRDNKMHVLGEVHRFDLKHMVE